MKDSWYLEKPDSLTPIPQSALTHPSHFCMIPIDQIILIPKKY